LRGAGHMAGSSRVRTRGRSADRCGCASCGSRGLAMVPLQPETRDAVRRSVRMRFATRGGPCGAAMPALHADLCYFLAATGCRISEALAARWHDMGLNADGRPCLTIPKSKTRAGERVLPLSTETVRRLTKRRAEMRFGDADHPIFASERGTQLNPHNFRVSQAGSDGDSIPSGLRGAKRRGKPWRTTIPNASAAKPPDLVEREFSAWPGRIARGGGTSDGRRGN